MSALPAGYPRMLAGQDETYARIRSLLHAVTRALLEEQPQLLSFGTHRPPRDRSSGDSWHGVQTLCHVSAMLTGSKAPDLRGDGPRGLIAATDRVANFWGMRRRSESTDQGITSVTWIDARGDLLEVVVGVRVAVRAISAPFLPGPGPAPSPERTPGQASPSARTSPSSPHTPPSRPAG